jgi:hypothetical protein
MAAEAVDTGGIASVATTEGAMERGLGGDMGVEAMIGGAMTAAEVGGATTRGGMGEGVTIGCTVAGNIVRGGTIAAATSLSAQRSMVSRIGAECPEVEVDI